MIYLVTKKEWFIEHPDIKCVSEGFVERIKSFLDKEEELAVDSETQGLSCHSHKMFCYQIGTKEHQFVIDHRVVPIETFKDVLEEKLLIFVNAKFDLKFFYKNGVRPKFICDLMLQEIILTNGLYTVQEFKGRSSFKGLSEKYLLDFDVDKAQGLAFTAKRYDERLFPKEIIYSAKDVENPIKIYEMQKVLIEQKGLQAVCDLENNFVKALADMEYNGITPDLSVLGKLKDEITIKRDYYKIKVEELLIESEAANLTIKVNGVKRPVVAVYENQEGVVQKKCTINWSSPAQVQSIIGSLGIELEEEDGSLSVDKQELLKIRKDFPFIDAYLEMQRYQALLTKFVEAMPDYINKHTGKIHTDFFQIVSTGRLSSRNPNLQNMPKGDKEIHIRDFFVSDRGEKLVTSDFNGCELRLIAEASQDPLWLETFREGRDLHSTIASELFNVPIELVAETPFPMKPEIMMRFVTKTINFGLAYGMSAIKLSATIGCDIEAAQEIIDNYFSKVPKVKEYLEWSGKKSVKELVAYSFPPISRPRYFPDEKQAYASYKARYEKWLASGGKNKEPKPFNWRAIQGGYERAGKNMVIQGTNAELTKISILNIYEYIQRHKFPAKLVNTVHDEIVCSVREDLAEEWAVIQEREMVTAAQIFIKSIPVRVDTTIDTKWAK